MKFHILDIHHNWSYDNYHMSTELDTNSYKLNRIYQYDRYTTSYIILSNVVFIKLHL